MAEIKLLFKGRAAIVFAIIAVVLLAAYYHMIEASVKRSKDSIREQVVGVCVTRAQAELDGSNRPNRYQSFLKQVRNCKTMQVAEVTSHGGLIMKVAYRVVLDEDHYVPEGRKVRYFRSFTSTSFPFTFYNSMNDDWPVHPIGELNALLYYFRL